MLFYRYIRGETEMTSSLTRNIGNVTKDTDITFEYGVRAQTSKSVHVDHLHSKTGTVRFTVCFHLFYKLMQIENGGHHSSYTNFLTSQKLSRLILFCDYFASWETRETAVMLKSRHYIFVGVFDIERHFAFS